MVGAEKMEERVRPLVDPAPAPSEALSLFVRQLLPHPLPKSWGLSRLIPRPTSSMASLLARRILSRRMFINN